MSPKTSKDSDESLEIFKGRLFQTAGPKTVENT